MTPPGLPTACFREGILGRELNGTILAKGTGGMEAIANDKWQVSMETAM